MTDLDLLAELQAQERAVLDALAAHGLMPPDPDRARLETLPPLLRDVHELPDEALCEAIGRHVAAGVDVDASPPDYGITAFRICRGEGKLAAMRALIRAGARTGWSADQIAIALGEVPDAPETGEEDPFVFACRVGNLAAAAAYSPSLEVGETPPGEAVLAAVRARSPELVRWLMARGFDPNAADRCGIGALQSAVSGDDVATAEVLLAAGADPNGVPPKDYTSPIRSAASEAMRALFVSRGISPFAFEYALGPDDVRVPFLPETALTQQAFEADRSARAGRTNPERALPAFWSEQMRTGRYGAPEGMACEDDPERPVWSFHRFGRTVTPLPDGRLVLIAGEHEDFYDPDFCIYADVTVIGGADGVAHYIYPEEVFPPTDFHTATRVDDAIWLVGLLGYEGTRQEGRTQVLRLDLGDFSVAPIETTGEGPGWLHGHRAIRVPEGILVGGGRVEPGYEPNAATYLLNLDTLDWRTQPAPGACETPS